MFNSVRSTSLRRKLGGGKKKILNKKMTNMVSHNKRKFVKYLQKFTHAPHPQIIIDRQRNSFKTGKNLLRQT